jgi:WD40 repeat protein
LKRTLVGLLALTLVLSLALVGGCKSRGGADQSGAGTAGTGTGGTGASSGEAPAAFEPGAGLPVELPSGRLAFGLIDLKPGSTWEEAMWLATVDLEGQNLTKHFVMHPDDAALFLSPDGTRLAARRQGMGGEPQWLLYDLSGGAVIVLDIPSYGYITEVYWSRCSRYIAYMAHDDPDAGTPSRIGIVNLDGTELAAQATTVRPSAGEGRIAWLVDANAFVFVGSAKPLEPHLYVHDMDTGQETQVVRDVFCTMLRTSPDGRHVAYYVGLMGGRVEIADMSTGAKSPVKNYSVSVTGLSWSPDGALLAIVYSNAECGPARVDFYDAGSRSITATTDLIAEWQYLLPPNLAWSADSRYLFLAADEKGVSSLSIYRIDPRDGSFIKIFACGETQKIRNLNATP